MAVAEVDRDIVGLVGQDGIRRIDGLPPPSVPEASAAPQPAPVVVTVVIQAPAPAYYADSGTQPASADTSGQYVSYPYPSFPLYPIAAVLNEPRERHRQMGLRGRPERLFRNPAVFTVR